MTHDQLAEIGIFSNDDGAQALAQGQNSGVWLTGSEVNRQGQRVAIKEQPLDDWAGYVLVDEQIHGTTGVPIASAA